MGRVTGPVGGSKSGRRTKVGKQLGRGDAALGGTSIRVMRQRQINPDGSIDRIKTISIHPPLLGSASFQRKYPGVANAMPPFRFTRIKEGIVAEIGGIGETFDHTLMHGLFSILTPDDPITVVEGAEVVEESYFREYIFNASVYGPDWEPNPQVASYKSGSSECWPRNFGYTGSIMRNQAGLFSGTMKKVVQLSAGLNIPIPYSFCWAKTHGIWVGSDGSHWLISISSDGIYAVAMPQERELTIEENEDFGTLIGYIPAFDPQLNENVGDWYMLATAGEVADAYDKSPMYATCGWAFSENGHECGNTCWQAEPNPTEGWFNNPCKKGYRYKIEIVGGEAPTSASMSEESDGWLWTEEQPFKVPIAIVLYEEPIYTLITFWLSSVGIFGGQVLRPLDGEYDIEADLHVWYDGNDEQVLKFKHSALLEELERDDCYPSDSTPVPVIQRNWYYDADVYTGGVAQLWIESDGEAVTDLEFVAENEYATFASASIFSGVEELGMTLYTSGLNSAVRPNAWFFKRTNYVTSGLTNVAHERQGIVPLFEREGVYIGNRKLNTTSGGNYNYEEEYRQEWSDKLVPSVSDGSWCNGSDWSGLWAANESIHTNCGETGYRLSVILLDGGAPSDVTEVHPCPTPPGPPARSGFNYVKTYSPPPSSGSGSGTSVEESECQIYFYKGADVKVQLVDDEDADSLDAWTDYSEWFRDACLEVIGFCDGPQYLVAHFDAFSVGDVEEEDNSGFFSNAPGGLHYVEDEDNPGYSVVPGYYIHNIDNEKYPIEGLSESNQWRGWFGVPKPEDET